MSSSLEFFRRKADPPGASAWFDRTDGTTCTDFCRRPVVCLNSLGHTANQLFTAWMEAGDDCPDPAARANWLRVARSVAAFCARLQRDDGDLPDVIDEANREVNRKSRIPARLVVAGL